MPVKRRSASHASSPVSKRVKEEPKSTEDEGQDLKSFLLSTILLVTNLRDQDNRVIAKEFFKLPSKKLYPEYYDEITSPISINEIKAKAVGGKYTNASEFDKDFELMRDNAVAFNGDTSPIAKDSVSILNFVHDQVRQFNNSIEAEDTIDYTEPLRALIQSMIAYRPHKRSKISGPFMDDVDGDLYPDYYKIIEKGMSFNRLLENLDTYKSDIPSFLADINLIWQNAQTYNDESSLIYQDSLKMCEHFYRKFADFVQQNDIEIEYEVPSPVMKQEEEEKVEAEEQKEEPAQEPEPEERKPEKRKRGRPRLSSLPPKEPLPIEFDDEEQEDEKMDDGLLDVEQSAFQEDSAALAEEELKPVSLTKLSVINKSSQNKFLGYKPHVIKSQHEVFKNFIKSVTVSSTKQLYKRSNLQDSAVGKFITKLEKDKSDSEKFFPSTLTELFEYEFSKDDLDSTNYTLTLKNVTSVQLSTALNAVNIGSQKYEQVLFFNGERISASTSIYEYDDEVETGNEDALSISKYDINLLPGLNALEFVCKVGPIIMVDKDGKLPSRHATNPNNESNYITERCCIWITVDQF